MLPQKGRLIASEASPRLELCAHDTGRARLGSAAGALPVDDATLRDEPADGLGHVGDPRVPPKFAVGEDLQANVALSVERREDGGILLGAQRVARERALGILLPRAQQLGGTQEAADVVGAERPGHACPGYPLRLATGIW